MLACAFAHLQRKITFDHGHAFIGGMPVPRHLETRRHLDPDRERPGLAGITGQHGDLCAFLQRGRSITPLQLGGVVHHVGGCGLRGHRRALVRGGHRRGWHLRFGGQQGGGERGEQQERSGFHGTPPVAREKRRAAQRGYCSCVTQRAVRPLLCRREACGEAVSGMDAIIGP